MVLALGSRLAQAVVVPDELSLTMWGHDAYALAVEPTNAVGRAEQLLLADPLPSELEEALDALRKQLSIGVVERSVAVQPTQLHRHNGHLSEAGGSEQDTRGHDEDGGHDEPHANHGEHAGHSGHDEHAGHDDSHGGHDHGDMMAIVGEPSSDGLVMEPIGFRYGPLATGLPGGLVLTVELDGDVVSRCEAEARLAVEGVQGPQRPLDPLAPAAWGVVIAELTELAGGVDVPLVTRWQRLAAVELERALSHVAWLRSMGRLLGWQHLIDHCQAAVTALLAARAHPGPAGRDPLVSARLVVRELLAAVDGSWLLRQRLAGRGRLSLADAPGLQGPNRRANGEGSDARSDHTLYASLDFEPVVEADGDALARTMVRVREAVQALDLALLMVQEAGTHGRSPEPPDHTVALEGPRGPIIGAHGDRLRLAAPGSLANLAAAGGAAVGLEWAAALATVASFDLSPWRVAG